MRAAAVLCLFMWSITITSAVSAEDGEWYAAIKTTIGYADIDSITDHGSIGTGALINGGIDGQLEDEKIYDYTAGVGFAVGRRMGYWNLSAEYAWRYRTDWDIVASTPSIQTITNVFSDVETSTLLLNLSRRGPINPYWSWEIGAGIGLVKNDIEAEYIERAVPGVRGEQRFKDNPSETEFTYNFFVGVTTDLGGPWTLNARLRHIELGDLESGPFPNRASRVSGEHSAQELQFSLERDF